MLVGPRDNNNNNKNKTSWILNWFSQLAQSGRSSSSSNENAAAATEIIPASPPPSDLPPRQQATSVDEDTPPPTPPPERRGSQQTVSTTRTFFSDSDDQYSTFSSARRRSSSERSMLKELWLKARKHHPHYPRFHWPSRNNHHNHHRRHHHHQHHLIFDPTLQQQQNELTTHSIPSSCSQRLSYDETMMIRADSSSCQELLHPHNKRHSITSLMSGDRITFASRPASIFCSQPASPMLSRTASRHNDTTSNDTTTITTNGDTAMDDLYSRINDDTRENRTHFLPDRWVIKPELVQLALDNGLFCSPFNISSSAGASEKHVLHVGCGDGTWASRVALEYPKWVVMGIDDRLSITHKRHRSPLRPNVRFLRDPEVSLLDMLRRFPDGSYDLVHCRFLILSLSSEQYQELVQECWRICKPGGYVELLEMDMRVYYTRPCTGKVMQLFNSQVIHAMENKALDPRLARQLNSVVGDLSQPGDSCRLLYHGNYKSLPLGVWGGRLGVMFRDDVRSLFERFRSIVAEKQQQQQHQQQDEYSLAAEDVNPPQHTPDSVLEQLDADMDSQRAFMNLHYTYAQKVDCI
ncbi:hypothetical protein RO3G_08090 [Lichtheimia corymbifera JMRC:FSU:9682]|uniref:Methyltransferase domain-containing protein n=1 Tax=Lichtheimia corymbifera JMRC:FSU:9682 TaxID=1263082 RepID=A0A068SD17_9FUNG|nr:hypothetical protein RO3G_08090 [Lichtheimia corymbifera JMRC:FSU:9682]